MAVANPQAPGARLPFQLFTRWIPEFLTNLPLALGGARVTTALDQVGYGDLLVLHVKGTYTVATATLVFLAGAPWNILANITVQPPGLSAPISVSGMILHVWNLAEKHFAPFIDGADFAGQGLDVNAFDAGNVDVFPTAVGAQTAHLWYVVPFHRSSMDVRGVLPLGNKSRTQLTLSIAAAADLVTTPANLTVPSFSVDVHQAYYTAPPAGIGADPDPYWSVTYEEFTNPITALGDQTINIEPNDSILGIIHYVILNGAGDSADINTLTLRVNKSYYHQGIRFDFWNFIQRRRLGVPLPPGVVLYDQDRFVDDGQLDVREWIHSQDVQTVQSVLNIPTGTLGTNPRIVTSVKRLVDLAPGQH
jgi:hypothetical protein